MTRRGELLQHLARLLAEAAPVVAELAALEGATLGETPKPPRRRRPPLRVVPSEPIDPDARRLARRALALAGHHLAAVPKE